MGKKTKRKRQHGRKKERTDQDDKKESGPAILQRIRHADPGTRHAALSGALHTIFRPDRITSSPIPLSLLQAVREKIMDRDIPTALVAASCLSNYLAFTTSLDEALTAGWLLIFVERLKECLSVLTSDSTNTKTLSAWVELTEQLLTSLCYLLENNSLALNKLVPDDSRRNTTPELGSDCVQLLIALLDNSQNYKTIQTQCCRFFHSTWDDNNALLSSLFSAQNHLAEKCLQSLQGMLYSMMPSDSAAVMHAVGAWLAATLLPFHADANWPLAAMLWSNLSRAVSLLKQNIKWDNAQMCERAEELQKAWNAFKEQSADDELEKQVVSDQLKKKEPARLIARRLMGDKMEAEKEEGEEDNEKHKLAEDRQDKEEIWENLQSEWYEVIQPIQIALEITANISSSQASGDDELMEDAMMNEKAAATLIEHDMPTHILGFIADINSLDRTQGPLVVSESAAELITKAVVCLGHFLSNLQSWTPPEHFWTDLRNLFEQHSNSESVQAAICSTMVVALRARSSIRKSFQPVDLDFVLSLLKSESTAIVREGICMLGILCTEESHPAEINSRVCEALMQTCRESSTITAKISPAILSETFNVLMDIYGEDDRHPEVFETLGVLSFFQRLLPKLKQSINLERDAQLEDIENWKETAMNASRFLQYKKGFT